MARLSTLLCLLLLAAAATAAPAVGRGGQQLGVGLGSALWWHWTGSPEQALLATAWADQRLDVPAAERGRLVLVRAAAQFRLGLEAAALASLAQVPDGDLDGPVGQQVRLYLAELHLRGGRVERAAALLANSAADADAGPLHTWLQAGVHRARGERAAEAEMLLAIPAEHALGGYARFNAAVALVAAGAPGAALDVLGALLATPPMDAEAAQLHNRARLALAALVEDLPGLPGAGQVSTGQRAQALAALADAGGDPQDLTTAMLLQGRQVLAADDAAGAARWFRAALQHGDAGARAGRDALAALPWALEQAGEPRAALLAYAQAAAALATQLQAIETHAARLPMAVDGLLATLPAPEAQQAAVRQLAGPVAGLPDAMAAPHWQALLRTAHQLDGFAGRSRQLARQGVALQAVAREQARRHQSLDTQALRGRLDSARLALRGLRASLDNARPNDPNGLRGDLQRLAERLAGLPPGAQRAAAERRLGRLTGLLAWRDAGSTRALRWQLRRHWTSLARGVRNLEVRLADLDARRAAAADPAGVPARLAALVTRLDGVQQQVLLARAANRQALVAAAAAALDADRGHAAGLLAWTELARVRLADQLAAGPAQAEAAGDALAGLQ